MNLPFSGAWPGAEFLFNAPAGARARRRRPSGYLFSVKRLSLEVECLSRDITWFAGQCGGCVRLCGFARIGGQGLQLGGPALEDWHEIGVTALCIQAAAERGERMDFSSMEIGRVRHGEEVSIHAETRLFVEPAKLHDLIHHLDATPGTFQVEFALEAEDCATLPAEGERLSAPLYDVVLSLQQPARNETP